MRPVREHTMLSSARAFAAANGLCCGHSGAASAGRARSSLHPCRWREIEPPAPLPERPRARHWRKRRARPVGRYSLPSLAAAVASRGRQERHRSEHRTAPVPLTGPPFRFSCLSLSPVHVCDQALVAADKSEPEHLARSEAQAAVARLADSLEQSAGGRLSLAQLEHDLLRLGNHRN